MKEKGRPRRALAAALDRDVSTATRICNGSVTPDKDQLQIIYDFTGGAITPNRYFNIPPDGGDGGAD